MLNAAKVVTEAVLGLDFRHVRVNGRMYRIEPPTLYRLAGAAHCLASVAGADSLAAILTSKENLEALPRALSWLIQGDEDLAKELSKGTPKELTDALETAYGLLSVQDFSKLSALAKNVAKMAANQKQ